LKKCPFCGEEPIIKSSIRDISICIRYTKWSGFLKLQSQEIVEHNTPDYCLRFHLICCGVNISGNSEYEVIKKWNNRK